MKHYIVNGMSCAACSARVEKAVSALDGVRNCAVNLLTNSMTVEGDVSAETVMEAVKNAGYSAYPTDDKAKASSEKRVEKAADEFSLLKKRLLFSAGFLIILMYFSMGNTMFGLPLPEPFGSVPVAAGLVQLLLCITVMIINQKFFVNGFKGLIHRAPNMDTLVSLGSSAAFVYSVYLLFEMIILQNDGKSASAAELLHGLYFESSAMILTLITVGKLLEAFSKGKTTDAVRSLMELSPQTACVIRNGTEEIIGISDMKKGDIFVVRSGQSISADGVVIEGFAAVDESALTGESLPVDKAVGDRVLSASVNRSGFLKCEAVNVGEESTLSRMIRLVSDASASKAPVARIADKVSGIFVPCVMLIALVTVVVWLTVGKGVGFALARGISVLVISCPCALGLATPVAVMVGSGVAAKHGILFKNATALEQTGKARMVALDKTGTVTSGTPSVTDVAVLLSNENELLTAAMSVESMSSHPLAQAVVKYCREKGINPVDVSDFSELSGRGVCCTFCGKTLFAGNLSVAKENCEISEGDAAVYDRLSSEGKTPLTFVYDGKLIGFIAVADTVRSDSKSAIGELKNMGLKVRMLTGDNEKTACAVGKTAGVDEVFAGLLPEGKTAVINGLKQNGKVLMVGDGINDAPALTAADIGMAIGAGTDIAMEAADVVLMKSRLSDVVTAVKISRKTLLNIKENLFWAFFYNVLGIPVAAGVFIPLFNLKLDPMIAAAAMSLSSFCVVTNALRLNFFKEKKNKKEKNMIKTLKITGMMCGHCSGRVKKALEGLDGVKNADVSHENGTAKVFLETEIDDSVLKSTVEAEGYTVDSLE